MRYFVSLTTNVGIRISNFRTAITFYRQSRLKSKWPAFLPVAFAAGLLLVQPCVAAPGQWEFTGSLNTARSYHTATLLLDGKVLVVGGANTVALASAELYDPASGTWSFTGSLNTARYGHTATLLLDGKVLVVGGAVNSVALASAEIYDPTTGTWAATADLTDARFGHTATLLSTGKVLVAGGGAERLVGSTEVYDPATGTWSFAGRKIVRYHHSHPGNRIDKWLLSGSITRKDNGGLAVRMSILPGAMAPITR